MYKQKRKRFPKVLRALALIAGLIALILTGTQPGSAGGYDYHADTNDPVGDAMGALPKHDTVRLQLFQNVDSLYIVAHFNAPISPPGSGSNEVLGYIDLDIDQNPTTGSTSHVSNYVGHPQCGHSGLGMEYYVDIITWVDG
jgi:hypothetical protein